MVCGCCFVSMFCGCCNDCRADVWPFFSRKKKVSCTRRICGSPFMIHVGEGWLWPHVTSLYHSKKSYNWQQLVKCTVFDLHRNGKVADCHWDLFF